MDLTPVQTEGRKSQQLSLPLMAQRQANLAIKAEWIRKSQWGLTFGPEK